MKMTYSWQAASFQKPNEQLLNELLNEIKKNTLPDINENFECSLVFVEDSEMAEINWSFLQHEGTTDVITFDYFNYDNTLTDGDTALEVIVCTEFAEREGKERDDSSFAEELTLYIAHAFLHASGLDDLSDEDKKIMCAAEAKLMKILKNKFELKNIFPETQKDEQ